MENTRTKRKYTVSDKVRAASRLNLEQARAVGHDILYRRTEKRVNANRANLLKARQSPKYKPYVRHGLRAVDLRESAPQVGETEAEYDRHRELVESVLPAHRQRKRNGVQGLAQALWRRRRLFGSRAHYETLRFYQELETAAADGLCPYAVRNLSFATWHLFLDGQDPRLELIMDRLDKRLVRVGEAYLTEYTRELHCLGVWGKLRYSLDLLNQPPEVIGNGLVGPGKVKRRMEKKGTKGGLKPAGRLDRKLKFKGIKSGLLAEWARQGYRLPDPRHEEDFALHLRLIEAAFFGEREAGFGLAKPENGNGEAGFGIRDLGKRRTPNPEIRIPIWTFESRGSRRPTLSYTRRYGTWRRPPGAACRSSPIRRTRKQTSCGKGWSRRRGGRWGLGRRV